LSLIVDYYDSAENIPREIMLDFSLEEGDGELLSEYLSIGAGRKVAVRFPERGDGRKLCDMALENAMEAARQHRLEADREDKSVKRLAELLGLKEIPRRIEAYDISNIGDENIVASMVVWCDGKLKKSEYRSFNISSTDGRDDYGSMRETLRRRLSHIGDGTASLGEMPDLILLDGGAAHVGVGKSVLAEMGLEISLFGMVKDDYHKTRAITDLETEVSIARELNVYSFVYNLQEEAHRFAVKHSMGAKRKSLRRSSLEKISGIGEAKARALLREMSLSEIKSADKDRIKAVKGISASDAERIYDYFHKS
jgi:excinuclease ABC subunit C